MHPNSLQLLLARVHQFTGLQLQLRGEYATISVESLKDFVLGKLLVHPGLPMPTPEPPVPSKAPKPTKAPPTPKPPTQLRRSTPPPPEYLEACQRIITCVKESGTGAKIWRLVDASGYNQADTTKMVAKLVEDGHLAKAGKGPGTHYMPPSVPEYMLRSAAEKPSLPDQVGMPPLEPLTKELLQREARRQLAQGPMSMVQLHAAVGCESYQDLYFAVQEMLDVRTEGYQKTKRYFLRESTDPTSPLTDLASHIHQLLIKEGDGLDRSQLLIKLGRPPQRGGVVMNAIRALIRENLVTVRRQGIHFIYQSKPATTPLPKPTPNMHEQIVQCLKGMPKGITSRKLRKRFPSIQREDLATILMGLVKAGVVRTAGNTQGMRYYPC